MIFWLIRHLRAAIPEGICYGKSDVAPGVCFAEEAKALLDRLRTDEFQIIYTSPLLRCRMLAELVGNPCIDDRLQELDFGQWEMRPWSEIGCSEMEQWRAHPLHWRVPGGESIADLARRSAAFLADLGARDYAKACVVTHGGVIRVLGCLLWRQPLASALDFQVPPGSALRIQLGPGSARLLDTFGFSGTVMPPWLR